MKHTLSLFCLLAVLSPSQGLEFTVTGGNELRRNVLVHIPEKSNEPVVAVEAEDGKKYPATILVGRLVTLDPKDVGKIDGQGVTFVLPELPAGKSIKFKTISAKKTSRDVFSWQDAEGEKPVLMRGMTPVMAYVRPTYDSKGTPAKQPANANPTTKIYHHIYAADGKTLLTNGAEGKFPHHRGIFYGFNRISYAGKSADIWHCTKGEHEAHNKVLHHDAGEVGGRHRLAVDWYGQDGKVFATETRELSVYGVEGGLLVEFNSILQTEHDKVKLDGDPQHAGFHFRANSGVEKTAMETYFLRPSGKGEKGKESNWDAKNKGPVNLPWNAMSYMLGDKRYTVVYLDHPENPKEARQSERNYGRIGTYFEYELSKDKPLKVQYRLWIQEGEVTAEQCEAMSKGFTEKLTK